MSQLCEVHSNHINYPLILSHLKIERHSMQVFFFLNDTNLKNMKPNSQNTHTHTKEIQNTFHDLKKQLKHDFVSPRRSTAERILTHVVQLK